MNLNKINIDEYIYESGKFSAVVIYPVINTLISCYNHK